MGHLRDMNGMKAIKTDCIFHLHIGFGCLFSYHILSRFAMFYIVLLVFVANLTVGSGCIFAGRCAMCPPAFIECLGGVNGSKNGEGQRQLRENEDIAQRVQGIACTPRPCMTKFVGTRGGSISWQAQSFNTSDSGIWSCSPGSYVHAVTPVWQAHY